MDDRRKALEEALQDYVKNSTSYGFDFVRLDAVGIAKLRPLMSEQELEESDGAPCAASLFDMVERHGGAVGGSVGRVTIGGETLWRVEVDSLATPANAGRADLEWLATLMNLGADDAQFVEEEDGSQFFELWWD